MEGNARFMSFKIVDIVDNTVSNDAMELLVETQSVPSENPPKIKGYLGLIALGLTGGAAVALSVVSYPFLSPALRRFCLPFVPATSGQVANVIKALKGRSGRLLDIGSGDGRIVIATAKEGFKSDGVELNLWLVLYSRLMASKQGLVNSTCFYRKDLWNFDIRSYNNIVIFGVKEMMQDLEGKFEKELEDAYVVACRFPLVKKVPIKTLGSGIDMVWLYHFKNNKTTVNLS